MVAVVVVADINNNEYKNEKNICKNETINVYEEMIQIIQKNELYYDKFRNNFRNNYIFFQKNKNSVQSKYTTSLPIPIPYKKLN
jgi:hypothetical protein